MKLSITDNDLTVSVEIQKEENESYSQPELLLRAALKAIDCITGGSVDAYYRINPDTLELRDESDVLWKAYSKYNLLYYEHLLGKE